MKVEARIIKIEEGQTETLHKRYFVDVEMDREEIAKLKLGRCIIEQ